MRSTDRVPSVGIEFIVNMELRAVCASRCCVTKRCAHSSALQHARGERAGAEYHPEPAGVLRVHSPDPRDAEAFAHHHQRHRELHDGDAQVADARVDPERAALHALWEEREDVRGRGGERAAADAACTGTCSEAGEAHGVVGERGGDRERDSEQGDVRADNGCLLPPKCWAFGTP